MATGVETSELSVLHRIAIAYLMLPVAVWLLGWFEWWVGVPLTVLLTAGLWEAMSGSWRIRLTPVVAGILLVTTVLVLLSKASGLYSYGYTWVAHRGILLDLGRGSWPTYLTDYFNDAPPLLRYYLGWFMVPGLAGKWFGASALNWAVPLWTWIGVSLMFLMFTRRLSTVRSALVAAAILFFFSGMDIAGKLLISWVAEALRLISLVDLGDFIDNWGSIRLDYITLNSLFQSNPHHYILGGLASLLLVQLRDHPRFLAVSGIVLAVCLFWSTLICLFGLVPLVIALIVRKGLRPFLKWPNLLVAPPLTVLLSLYLTSGERQNFQWLWQISTYDNWLHLVADVARLYLIEFLVLAFLLYRTDRRILREPFFIASLMVLAFTPWVTFGAYISEDGTFWSGELHTRAVIPALFVLCYYAAHITVSRLPETAGHPVPHTPLALSAPSTKLLVLLVAVLSVGAIWEATEYTRAAYSRVITNTPQLYSYERTQESLLIDRSHVVVSQRTAYDVPSPLKTLLRDSDSRGGPKGELIISSEYDIYLNGNRLIYVNHDCNVGDQDDFQFQLHVYPYETTELLPARRHDALNVRWDKSISYSGRRCIVSSLLLEYNVARIDTGQYIADGDFVWKVEYTFDPSGDPKVNVVADAEDFYRRRYEDNLTGQPAIRSIFDIYLNDGILTYIQEPCREDPEAVRPFFLHIIPKDLSDLPNNRRHLGSDNLDFQAVEDLVTFDDVCLITAQLPQYDIALIRTGQLDSDLNSVWSEEFQP